MEIVQASLSETFLLDMTHKSLETVLAGLFLPSPAMLHRRVSSSISRLVIILEQRSQLVTSCVLFESRTIENS